MKFHCQHLLLVKSGLLVGGLLGIKILFEHLEGLFKLSKLPLHLVLLHLLVGSNFLVLGLLLSEVLKKLAVLLLGRLEAVACVITELLDQLKSLDGFCFDFAVVTLHYFKIAAESVELRIKKTL